MVFEITHDELERLYSAPGLEQYQPEAILVQTFDGDTVAALCYTLSEVPQPGEANAEYAVRLRAVLSKLEFPQDYVASIA
jgi:hypothetical protein